MNHLKNFIDGVRQVLVLDTGAQYIRPSRSGFYRDVSLLQGDARKIAQDLSRVTKKHKHG